MTLREKWLALQVCQFVTWLRFAKIGFVLGVFIPIALPLPLDLGSFGGYMRPLLMSNPSQEPSVDSMRTQVEAGACSEALTLSIQIETL